MQTSRLGLINDVKEYIDLIRAANKSRRSPTRDEYIDAAKEILAELRSADDSDTARLEELEEQYVTLDETAQFLQNQALIQWSTNYADLIEELGNFHTGRKSPTYGGAINLGFVRSKSYAQRLGLYRSGQSQATVKKITDELRELYVILLMQRVDTRLALESGIRLKPLENQGFLTSSDLPNLYLVVISNPIGGTAARAAALMLARMKTLERLRKEAKDAANPSVFRRAWDWFGWDSFTDFAIDMGLILATGGAGAVGVWGKRAAKGARNLRKIGKARKFKKIAKLYDDELKRVEEALQRARGRLRRSGKGRKTVQRLEQYYREIVKFWFETGEEAFESFKKKKEFVETMSSAWKLITKVLTSVGADSIQESLGIKKGKTAGEIATKEIAKAALNIPVNEFRDLSDRIKNAQEAFTKGESLKVKSSRKQLFLNWYELLVLRQLAIRSLEVFFRKGSAPSASDLADVFIKSLISALEEAAIAFYVPRGIIEPVLVQLGKVVRKVLAGVIVTFIQNLIDNGTISYRKP